MAGCVENHGVNVPTAEERLANDVIQFYSNDGQIDPNEQKKLEDHFWINKSEKVLQIVNAVQDGVVSENDDLSKLGVDDQSALRTLVKDKPKQAHVALFDDIRKYKQLSAEQKRTIISNSWKYGTETFNKIIAKVRSMAEKNLLEAGFQRIGDSSFFQKRHAVVQISNEGQMKLYVDRLSNETDLDSREIRAITIFIGKNTNTEQLMFVFDGDRHRLPYITIPGSSGTVDKRYWQDAIKKTLAEQLREQGIREEENAHGIYKLKIHKEGDPVQEYLLVTRDHQFTKLFVLANDFLQEKLENASFLADSDRNRIPSSDSQSVQFESENLIIGIGKYEPQGFQRSQVNLKAKVPLEKIPLTDLGVTPYHQTIDAKTGFIYGGINNHKTFDQLTEINGVPIQELEKRMRPLAMSVTGFIGSDESFADVLKTDNKWVLENGLTHRDLANVLYYA